MPVRWAPKPVRIPVSHGFLEGLLQEPEQPTFAAVACHPHPLQGGAMSNNVIYRVARGLYDGGGAVLRFNFRGVGRSTGSFGDAIGEQEDVTAALDFVAALHPALPLWCAGFSFGARVGLEVGARDSRVVKLLGVGLAPTVFDLSFLLPITKPRAFIQGERDEFGSGDQVTDLVARMAEPKRLEIVPGASHLFAGKHPELELAIGRAVEFLKAC
jgi:hypothetical protein